MDGGDWKKRGSQKISAAAKHRRWSAPTTVTPSLEGPWSKILKGCQYKSSFAKRKPNLLTRLEEIKGHGSMGRRWLSSTSSPCFVVSDSWQFRENFKNWPKTVTFWPISSMPIHEACMKPEAWGLEAGRLRAVRSLGTDASLNDRNDIVRLKMSNKTLQFTIIGGPLDKFRSEPASQRHWRRWSDLHLGFLMPPLALSAVQLPLRSIPFLSIPLWDLSRFLFTSQDLHTKLSTSVHITTAQCWSRCSFTKGIKFCPPKVRHWSRRLTGHRRGQSVSALFRQCKRNLIHFFKTNLAPPYVATDSMRYVDTNLWINLPSTWNIPSHIFSIIVSASNLVWLYSRLNADRNLGVIEALVQDRHCPNTAFVFLPDV